MSDCPCKSGIAYAECCEPIIKGEKAATTAEQLMRARYSAYAQCEIDFLRESNEPKSRSKFDPESAKQWAQAAEWLGFEVLSTEGGGENDDEGTVEFMAKYCEKAKEGEEDKERPEIPHHEVSRFQKIDGKWYFVSGRVVGFDPIVNEEAKVGRNDPCPCGSGKKYKKCCGK